MKSSRRLAGSINAQFPIVNHLFPDILQNIRLSDLANRSPKQASKGRSFFGVFPPSRQTTTNHSSRQIRNARRGVQTGNWGTCSYQSNWIGFVGKLLGQLFRKLILDDGFSQRVQFFDFKLLMNNWSTQSWRQRSCWWCWISSSCWSSRQPSTTSSQPNSDRAFGDWLVPFVLIVARNPMRGRFESCQPRI